MSTKCYTQVRGSVIRVTRLDACAEPSASLSSVSVSKRVSTVTVDEVTEDGTNIRDRNFGDELITVDDSYTSVIGYSTEIALMGVDPDLVSIFTGQRVVKNAKGDVVGFDVDTNVNLDGFGFSLEVWSKIAGSQCDPSGNRLWGYTVFPFLKGGRIGGFSFENAAVNFTITGAQTRDGNAWGVGPFDVDRNATGVPSPMFEALSPTAPFRNMMVSLDPPAPSCGAFSLGSA